MDLLTHACAGASIGAVLASRKIGFKAVLWGIFFGLLPDIDVLFSFWLSPIQQLWWHRGPTHSLLVIAITTLISARLLSSKIAPQASRSSRKKPLRKHKQQAIKKPVFKGKMAMSGWILLIGSALLSHALLDCCTIYGTSLFYPFSSTRIAWGNLFIIDPLILIILIFGLLRGLSLRKPEQEQRRGFWYSASLLTAMFYIGVTFCFQNHLLAKAQEDLRHRNIHASRWQSSPTPFNTLLWRHCAIDGDRILVSYRSIFDTSKQAWQWTVYPRHQQDSDEISNEPSFKTLNWFANEWLIYRKSNNCLWIGDMRFGDFYVWDKQDSVAQSRPLLQWRWRSSIIHPEWLESYRPKMSSDTLKDYLIRVCKRILGDYKSWNTQLRLSSIPGTLPESLDTLPNESSSSPQHGSISQ